MGRNHLEKDLYNYKKFSLDCHSFVLLPSHSWVVFYKANAFGCKSAGTLATLKIFLLKTHFSIQANAYMGGRGLRVRSTM